MKERPILFSAPMVLAILAGKKTQTRRIITERNSTVLGQSGKSLWHHLHFDHPNGVHKDRGTHIFGMGPDCDYLHVPAWHPEAPEDVVQYRVRPINEPADRLWVREAFREYDHVWTPESMESAVQFRADFKCRANGRDVAEVLAPEIGWRPSIFMPRPASRISLEITQVRAERLCDISENDASAEGVLRKSLNDGREVYACGESNWTLDARAAYRMLWESINGAGSWLRNDWVWIYDFRRIT